MAMIAHLLVALQAPPERAVPVVTPVPAVREVEVGPFVMRTTQFLAWRPQQTRNFGWDIALQPVFLADFETKLPVLRHFMIQLESAPATSSQFVSVGHARLLLKLPRGARLGLEQSFIGAWTKGMPATGFFNGVRGPRVVFTTNF
jgi:hypothetical protein